MLEPGGRNQRLAGVYGFVLDFPELHWAAQSRGFLNRGNIMNIRYYRVSKSRAVHGASLAAIAMGFAMPSHAQESQSEGLTEIIVTAEKREENLQSVPVSVTAMTG